MVTWALLEAAVSGRDGWKRSGREWHGPCPISGVGQDCCFVATGTGDTVLVGCRYCGKLDRQAFREHLAALCGPLETSGGNRPFPLARTQRLATPRGSRYDRGTPNPLPRRVWEATIDPTDTPGEIHLVRQRRVWPAGVRLPAAVRWLPVNAARDVGCRPRLPGRGCAGALVYHFRAPGEAETHAIQIEAISATNQRMPFIRHDGTEAKRPAVNGSLFGSGRRVFIAAFGSPGAGCWLVEGPLDALAVVRLAHLHMLELGGAAVLGTMGTTGFTVSAVEGWPGLVTIAPDRDTATHPGAIAPGDAAAVKLAVGAGRAGRDWRIHRSPLKDWSDWAASDDAAEREALRDE